MVLLDRQTDSAAKRKRLTYIDAARGMAVLMVAIQHTLEKIVVAAGPSAFGRGLNDLIGYYFNFGRFGVVLFFFISGFVVPNSFPNTQKPIRDFAVNRLLRLYPMYWLSILFCVTVVPLYTGVAFPLHQVLINITMFQAFFGVDGLNVFYWTLAVELMFYIICAALFWIGLLQRARTAAVIAILGSIGGALALLFLTLPGTGRLVELTLNFMAMFLGKAIRDHFHERRVGGGLLCAGIAAYTAFALTVSLVKYGGPYVPSTFFSSTAMATSYIGAMALFLVLNAFPDRFDWPRLAAVGVISYSIYLIHPFVLDIYVHSIGVGSSALEWILVLVVTLASSAALSVATYNLLERNCILLGRRLRSDRVAPAPDRADRVPV